MQFRTEIQPPDLPVKIEHHQKILTIGSCFADNLAGWLGERFMQVLNNPFGVQYNPLSIARGMVLLTGNKQFSDEDLIEHNGLWHSFDHHSFFSESRKTKVIDTINRELDLARQFIQSCEWLIITLGTAYVYHWKENGQIVSNCHKIPSARFERRLTGVEEIREAIIKSVGEARRLNNRLKCIFTISPIRHLKDGAVNNQRSKAALFTALHQALDALDSCYYFPAYEIVLDDLRDYRFYEANLTHPNDMAIAYIMEKFSDACCSRSCKSALNDFEQLNRAGKHRPRNPHSPEHQKFIEGQIRRIDSLQKRYPHADLHAIRAEFAAQIQR